LSVNKELLGNILVELLHCLKSAENLLITSRFEERCYANYSSTLSEGIDFVDCNSFLFSNQIGEMFEAIIDFLYHVKYVLVPSFETLKRMQTIVVQLRPELATRLHHICL